MSLICVDIDGTLIRGQTQVMLVRFLFRKGKINLLDYLSVFYWYFRYKFLGSGVDEGLANKMYKKIIGGLSEEEVSDIVEKFLKDTESRLDSKVIEYVKELKERNDEIVIITTTIEPVATRFCELVGATKVSSTVLEKIDRRYTGNTVNGVNGVESKKDFIKQHIANHKKIIVITDHENDLELLKMADNPVVVNPTKKLKDFANESKWEIITT